jgi:hypothetical protein
MTETHVMLDIETLSTGEVDPQSGTISITYSLISPI